MTNKKHKKLILSLLPLALFLYFIPWPGNVTLAARKWQSGAEVGSTSINVGELGSIQNNNGSFTIVTSPVRTGTYAYQSSVNSAYRSSVTGLNSTEIYARAYFRISSTTISNRVHFFTLINSADSGILRVFLNTNATLDLVNGSSGTDVTVGTSSTALSANTWYRIEVHALVAGASAGAMELKINGATEVSNTGLTTNGKGNVDALDFGIRDLANPGMDFFFDDLAVNDTTGTLNNSWPGAGAIVNIVPGSDTTIIQWGIFPSTPTTHFDKVSEIPEDGLTTFVSTGSSTTVGLEDRWNMADTPAAIGTCDTVNALLFGFTFDHSNTAGTVKFRARDASNNTADGTAATSTSSMVDSYPNLVKEQTWAASPAALTKSYVDGVIGAVVKADTVNSNNRVTAAWADVDYTTASCPAPATRNRFTFASLRKFKISKGLVRIRLH